MRRESRYSLLVAVIATVWLWPHAAGAALLGLSNIIPTPQPYVTAEEISGTWTKSTKKLVIDGNGSLGGSNSWTEGNATQLFTAYGRWHLELTVGNNAGTVFSGNLTVRGNRQGGAALDSGDGKTDEILFQSTLMLKFGFSVNSSPTATDLFEFIFKQQATNVGAYPPNGFISVIVPLGQTIFTGTGTQPFNINNFTVSHLRPTVFYPEPSATVLFGIGAGTSLLRRRRWRKRQ